MSRRICISCIALVLAAIVALGCAPARFEPVLLSEAKLVDGEPVPVPDQAAVVLRGLVTNTNQDDTLALDIATLEQLTVMQYPVDDPWLDQPAIYSGVPITALLAFAGAPVDVESIHVLAWDGYVADIPLREVQEWSILLATRDGNDLMTLENCGPTRLILPYQLHPDEAQARAISVWSIREIEVR